MVSTAIDRTDFLGSDLATLFQRILLITDGTVTHLLETFAGEPIRVVKLRQSVDEVGDGIPELELAAHQRVIRREVLLVGAGSARTFLYASSQIVPDRLEASVREGLLQSNKPIGRLLEESKTETFREITDATREPAGDRARHLGIDPAAVVISRSYRVLAGGHPIMLITEKFPADAFLLGTAAAGVAERDWTEVKGVSGGHGVPTRDAG